MKKTNLWKRVLSIALAGVLAVGAMSQGTTAEAKAKHTFVVEHDIAPCVLLKDGTTEWEIFSAGKELLVTPTVKKGKTVYATFQIPNASKVKSSSLTSSNKKVLKVVNKKQGKIKAVKKGTAKLTVKVTWKYTGKACTIDVPVLKGKAIKVKKMKMKKGKTYSLKYTYPVKVN